MESGQVDRIKSHSRQQILCFGQDGLLRRHDFTIDNIILR